MKVWVNGEPAEIEQGTVAAVLEALELDTGLGVALAIDGEVVPRSTWSDAVISPGQRIEVVRAVQGG